jgi:hypothetical protein
MLAGTVANRRVVFLSVGHANELVRSWEITGDENLRVGESIDDGVYAG